MSYRPDSADTNTRIRGRNLAGLASGDPPGGQPRLNQRRAWPCPKCAAGPGQPCQRFTGGRIDGEPVDGGYWRAIKGFHPERKAGRAR